ncbi:bifunctional 2-polyprenyl-6-hydroxyphenol methylase/3-demethylubiquinol 3-O-methyltransferase UbiG [Lacinutrix sp. 5H-3-7-4]|uniref:class I SAM-dependent methyltransferase n=1 Tax=Lacinutrix sp. (strain 5H-3-7-4) TaxID=983544 RepID=UPI00020A3B8A|nr:class I SAM-dependent methyltransferase [Lacinutrix sp. 5H-3-7-4]AEH01648.1 Methyltransferase type 11 [Lacinutrix sp. 5H-3-7-4]
MKDLFGNALLDYFNNTALEDIITSTNISDEDTLPLDYLFRDYTNMPKIEQKALDVSQGKILDVGCGAGSHSLYLQEKGKQVKAIDVSKGAIAVSKKRGVINAQQISLLDETETFDTILLLMNGTGIFQTIEQLPQYLKHLKSLLNKDGQILIDSSDIKYMYEDEDGGFWQDLNSGYYGELDYFLSYKGVTETPMKWLYLDFTTLNIACASVGLKCEMLAQGEHFDYLAKIYV